MISEGTLNALHQVEDAVNDLWRRLIESGDTATATGVKLARNVVSSTIERLLNPETTDD